MERPCRSCGFPSMGSRPCPDDDAGRCRDTAHAPAGASPSPPAHDGTPRRAEADEPAGRHRSGAADSRSPVQRCRGGTVRAAPTDPSASVRCRRATRAPWRTAVPGPTMPGPESDLAFGQSGLIRCTAGACALRLRRWRAAMVPCRLSVQTRRTDEA